MAHATYPGQNGELVYGVAKYDKRQKARGYVGFGALQASAPDGSWSKPLADDAGYDDVEPMFSPDGTRLAVASAAGGKFDGIYIGAPDLADPIFVSKAAAPDSPTWSPDGRRLAYVDYGKGIFVVPARRGSKRTRLVADTKQWSASAPAYAPDGRTIVFQRQTTEAFSGSTVVNELWAMDPSGGNQRRILGGKGTEFSTAFLPDVSPDSSHITFTTWDEASKTTALWVAGIDGSAPRRVLAGQRGRDLTSPVWSPDGTKIAVSTIGATPRNGSALLVVDVATGAATTIRRASKAYLINPTWQPIPAKAPVA